MSLTYRTSIYLHCDASMLGVKSAPTYCTVLIIFYHVNEAMPWDNMHAKHVIID